MTKRLSLLLLSIAGVASAFASYITPQQALSRLSGGAARKVTATELKTYTLADTRTSEAGTPTVYVFNRPANRGYLILPADDCAAPVLGYADRGSYAEAQSSPELQYWLGEYSRQIEYAAEKGITYSGSTRAGLPGRKVIAPLLKTKWNQGAPYNYECPVDNGSRSVTGCVATAMAQVMNYWKYPEIGHGTVSARIKTTNTTVTMDLGLKKFDWANMLDVYNSSSSTEQEDAVAYLMKCCGYSVNMGYSSKESGAQSVNVGKALIANFDYNPNMDFIKRSYVTDSQWDEYVYNELAAGRPVYYSGFSTQAGHAFVCDGYDNEGYYHFNWGWGGSSDGYFLLQALNPGTLGIGGGTGGYNVHQDIIVGLQPKPAGEPVLPTLTMTGTFMGSTSGSTVKFWVEHSGSRGTLWNYTFTQTKFPMALQIMSADGSNSRLKYVTFGTVDINQASGIYAATASGDTFTWKSFDFSDEPDGDYIVTLGVVDAGVSNFRAVKAAQGCSNKFRLRKAGGQLTVTNNEFTCIDIVSGGFVSPLFLNNDAKVSVTVTNPFDVEYTQVIGVALLSYDYNLVFRSEGPMVALAPHETRTVEFITSMILQTGQSAPTQDTEYKMYFVDNEANIYYSPELQTMMRVSDTAPALTTSSATIVGATKKTEYINRYDSNRQVFQLDSEKNIPFSITAKNNGGFFAGYIKGYIFDIEAGTSSSTYCTYPFLALENGESGSTTASYNFVTAEPDKVYLMQHFFKNGSSQTNFGGSIFFRINKNVTAVDDATASPLAVDYSNHSRMLAITSEAAVDAVTVTAISGQQVLTAANLPAGRSELSLAELPAGIYMVAVRSATHTRTLKVIR